MIRVRRMLIKELRQALRDPRLRILLFLPPLLQLILFGYAVNLDVHSVRTAICDLDHSPESREFSGAILRNGWFIHSASTDDPREIARMLDDDRITCGLVIGRGFARDLVGNGTARVGVILDGTDSNRATRVSGYLATIADGFIAGRVQQRLAALSRRPGGTPTRTGRVELVSRTWFNETLESRNYFVPGIVGTILMLVTLMLTSMAVVREKEAGTLEQLMVTPIRPLEFILGKTLPFVFIGLVQATVILFAAVFWFGIAIKGSILLLYAGILIFLVSCLSLGLFVSTLAETLQQASLLTTFFFLPSITLSGFIFPIENMPAIVRFVSDLIPLRWFLVIIRGIVLKGVGLEHLGPHFVILTVLALGIATLAVLRFHKSLD